MNSDRQTTIAAVESSGSVWKGPRTPPPRADAVWNAHKGCWMVPLDAIDAERAACAKIADDTSAWCRSLGAEETAERIAAAIRARKGAEPQD